MDKTKYEWGRTYARLLLGRWKTKSIASLIRSVDAYRLVAYQNASSFDLGMADQIWQLVLEKEYKRGAS